MTDFDLLRIAEERGLTLGVLGSRALGAAKSWFGEQYELNTAALRDLGLMGGGAGQLEEPPSFDEVLRDIGVPSLVGLGRRRGMGFRDNLVVYPSVEEIGLRGTPEEPGFVPRFDRKQGTVNRTKVSEEVWGQLPDKNRIHDPLGTEGWNVALVLDSGEDGTKATAFDMGSDTPKGLLYTGMSADDQRAILETDKEDNEFSDYLELGSVTVPQVIMLNAQRRVQGSPLLDDTDSFTRLVHYPDLPVSQVPKTPSIITVEGQIQLGESEAKKGFSAGGIRQALHVLPEVPPEESAA